LILVQRSVAAWMICHHCIVIMTLELACRLW